MQRRSWGVMVLKAEAVTTPSTNMSSRARSKFTSRDQQHRRRRRSEEIRRADPAGQKRKPELEAATTTSQSKAKAKSADPAGQKRKPESEKEAATAPRPSKTKVAEPAGEKRKVDEAVEDVEETEGQGSPTKARLDDGEDIRRAQGTSPATAFHVATLDLLELHSGSGVAKEADKFEMNTVDLGLWDLDNISNRDRVTELVREKKSLHAPEQSSGTYSVYMWALSITGSRRKMVRT